MAPIMARPCIQYNLDIKLTGLLHRLRLNFRCVVLRATLPVKWRYIMEDTTQNRPYRANCSSVLNGKGFNLLVGSMPKNVGFSKHAV
jgi:hypothetical protein